MKRICLFAGFDKQGIVDDYVVYYIQELSKLADVYYWADCDMCSGELAKLAHYVKGAYAKRHEKYDFGSWQELITKLGWGKVAEYDELILVNDSCYGPVYPLAPIFDRMEKSGVDFWGITKNIEIAPHIQSYFLVFNKNVVQSEAFQIFFDGVKKEKNKNDVIINYEIANTLNLKKNGFKDGVVLLKELRDNPTVRWKVCLQHGVPFIKVCNFSKPQHSRQNVYGLKKYVLQNTDYDYQLIKNHQKRMGINFCKVVILQIFIKSYRVANFFFKKCGFLQKLYIKVTGKCPLIVKKQHELNTKNGL